jgi:hypothetical protein
LKQWNSQKSIEANTVNPILFVTAVIMGHISDNRQNIEFMHNDQNIQKLSLLLLYNYIFTPFAPYILTVTFRESKFVCRPRNKIDKNI